MVSTPTFLAVLSFLTFFIDHVLTTPIKYDQRQEGELNIRTDLQDVVFVVVPPKDILSAGMGVVANTAANFLKFNRGGFGGPNGLPSQRRPSSKLGFLPFKFNFGKPGLQSKRIVQFGDPNRYNFNNGRFPIKGRFTTEATTTTTEEEDTTEEEETTTEAEETTTMAVEDDDDEMMTTTEGKSVKKTLKNKKNKKNKNNNNNNNNTNDNDDENNNGDENDENNDDNNNNENNNVTNNGEEEGEESNETEEPIINFDSPRIAGEFSPYGMDPSSIFSHEGCGPDAYRDLTGVCVYKRQIN